MGSKKAKTEPRQDELANAQLQGMREQTAMSKEQFEWMKGLAEQDRARGDEQWDYIRGLQDEANDRSRFLFDRYRSTVLPNEDKFFAAVENANNEGNRERQAGMAMADVERGISDQRAQTSRGLGRMGINPASGAYASMYAGMDANNALAKVTAGNMAREAARREGLNLRAQAAGFGQALQGASAGYLGASADMGGASLNAGGMGLRSAGNAWQGYNMGQQGAMNWGNSANSTLTSMRQGQNGKGGLGSIFQGGLQGFQAGGWWGAAAGAAGGAMQGR
jgi:hypothetical protein